MPFVSQRGNKYFLVAKLIRCGMYFIRPGGRSSSSDTLIRIIRSLQIPVVACYSDRSSDFNRVKTYCERNNIQYNPSHLGRDQYKGYQESAMAKAKQVMEWFLANWDHENPSDAWEMTAYAAEHVLNTRASPSRLLIPFHVCFGVRPRYDLFPLSVVSYIHDSKLNRDGRTEPVIFLCQSDAQSAFVWRFANKPIEIANVHINSLRSSKFNLNNIDAFLKPLASVNALSLSARPIKPAEKKTQEWRDAIVAHANKLVGLNFAAKPTESIPENVVRSFFVGRNVDGALNARLVANGGLSLEGQVLDQYLPSLSERFAFLTLLARSLTDGFIAWSGDISGAYYATKGEGFIRLPTDWPSGIGGFYPNEVVQLRCAIPGDRLSSGLFLNQFDSLLTSNGFEIVYGRTKRFTHSDGSISYLLNYSDDLLGLSPSLEAMKEIESIIRKTFNVTLEAGVPPKWVGLDLSQNEKGELLASSASTFLAYDIPYLKFSLDDITKLKLQEKCSDKSLIKESLSTIGKLLYGASINPWLTYLASFLASAAHYDPTGADAIAKAAIHYYSRRPVHIVFRPINPKV